MRTKQTHRIRKFSDDDLRSLYEGVRRCKDGRGRVDWGRMNSDSSAGPLIATHGEKPLKQLYSRNKARFDSGDVPGASQSNGEQREVKMPRFPKFCPQCGCNLSAIMAALNLH